jgi:hypothetical protein
MEEIQTEINKVEQQISLVQIQLDEMSNIEEQAGFTPNMV